MKNRGENWKIEKITKKDVEPRKKKKTRKNPEKTGQRKKRQTSRAPIHPNSQSPRVSAYSYDSSIY